MRITNDRSGDEVYIFVMRATSLILILGLLKFTLLASPILESKPDDNYFSKFQPIKAPSSSGLFLKEGDCLAICGDSITEQKMYSRLVEDYLTMCVPQLHISVRQYGWSGERASGFLSRMTNDCLRFHPTVATTCYGMNDFEYRPYNERIGQIYYTNSMEIAEAFKADGVRVILGSPGCISKMPPWVKSTDYTVEDLNLSLCNLRNIDLDIANKEHVRFADVFWPMLIGGYMGKQEYGPNYGIPGNEGVHPHWAGHLIMAYALLKAMGLDGNIGTFTIDLNRNKIDVSPGHKVISATNGEFTIESYRYPFCPCEPDDQAAPSYPASGKDSLSSDNSIRSGMTLVPFNHELNRLMLVVKDLTTNNYQVNWGNESRVFAAAQLAQGINLAEDFPNNPFNSAFAQVDAAVTAKQGYETTEVKDLFRNTNHNSSTEAIVAETDKVVEKAEEDHDALAAEVRSAFVPVTHTITIAIH